MTFGFYVMLYSSISSSKPLSCPWLLPNREEFYGGYFSGIFIQIRNLSEKKKYLS